MNEIQFGSVCSGIEAASVAWRSLGWRAAWVSEIDKAASALLAHRYPAVPNLGDMTRLPARVRSGEIVAPDVFCGGTPCQAFSVAGLRKSLDDARGNLSLVFCEIADEIDAARSIRGDEPCIVFWENVPGVLNTRDNAFGCFLAGLAGEGVALQPAGGKWTNAGCVFGPKRTVAWRVLDAQYFGVAQRRRRVFVVASARKGFDPATVLFEFEGVRRDTAPSRKAGEGTARGVEFGPSGGRFTDLNPTLDTRAKDDPIRNQLAGAVITMAHGQGGAEIRFDCGPTLTCNHEAPIAAYANAGQFGAMRNVDVSDAIRANGGDTGGGGETLLAPVAYAIQAGALRENPNSGPDGVGIQEDVSYTLEARAEVQCVAFAENSCGELRLEGGDGSRIGALSTGGGKPGQGVPTIAFSSKDHGADATEELSPTPRAMTHAGSHANGGGQVAIAFPERLSGTQYASTADLSPALGALNPMAVALRGRDDGATAELGDDAAFALRASTGGGDKPHVLAPVAYALNADSLDRSGEASTGTVGDRAGLGVDTELAYLLKAGRTGRPGGVSLGMQVRRLTPRECERLQGFQWRVAPDHLGAWEDAPGEWWSPDYTLIPGKTRSINPAKLEVDYIKYLARGGAMSFQECCNAAADGPRYKQLGNSWAVPCIYWIGARIDAELRRLAAAS